jgi:hypothetical protein
VPWVRPMRGSFLLAPVALALACATDVSGASDGIDDDVVGLEAGKADGLFSADETAAMLALVNHASLDVLDDDAALDRRAAVAIVAHRDGSDATLGTEDDDAFDDLAELDAVSWVGPVAFSKLLDYALVHDFGGGEACLIISEYAEGQTNYNKALELWNCGDEPLALAGHEVCLVRNADTSCTLTSELADVELAAGDTWVVCRTTEGTFNDPLASLRSRCDQAMAGTLAMSGDDRYALLDPEGNVLDAFGRLSWRPSWEIWADVVLRRCDLAPRTGTEFFETDEVFTSHPRHDHTDLGVAPVAGTSCD